MTTYLLIDTQNLGYRNFKITPKSSPIEDRIGLTLHNILTITTNAYRIFEADHCVFCFDSSSWRKMFYPQYKANRVALRAAMRPSERKADDEFRESLNELKAFLDNKTNVTVLHCDGLEADDLIAGWIRHHSDDHNVIVSNDTDFIQLISDNVNIYNGKNYLTPNGAFFDNGTLDANNKFTPNHDVEYELFKKCIRGDSSDNIFSAYPGVREKGSKNTVGIIEAYNDRTNKGFKWNSFMNSTWYDHNKEKRLVKEQYEINRNMIDLRMMPPEVNLLIDNTIQQQSIVKKKHGVGVSFLQFCRKHQLNRIMNDSQNIGIMLNRHYKD